MDKTKSPPRKPRILPLVVALCMVLVCFLGGSLAKYLSSATSVSNPGTVAKWQLEVNDEDIASVTPKTLEFDLFSTIREEDATTEESHVVAGKIAPGVGGCFELEVVNYSEVNAEYTLALTEVASVYIPIECSFNKSDWYGSFAEINAVLTDRPLDMLGGSESILIYWRWAYDGDEVADLAIGESAATSEISVSISAELIVEQAQGSTGEGTVGGHHGSEAVA